MEHFSIYKSCNDKHDDDKQEGYCKNPRFLPITHADQPSTSAGNDKEGVRPTEEQSAYSDVSIEDVKKKKGEAYHQLESLLEGYGQETLEDSKSETSVKSDIPSKYVNKLIEGVLYCFRPEKKERLIDQEQKEEVAAVEGFLTHYKDIDFVYFAIKLVKDINEWIDTRKYPTNENELIEELQENIQAVHRSLEELDLLFSGKNHQAYVSREEKVASFVTKELSKLEEMKQSMEEIDQKEGGKKLGSRGKRALETMKKYAEHAERILSAVRDDPHTLGDLESSLEDVSKKLYHLAEIVAIKELDNAKELISEVKKKGWDNERTIKNVLVQRDHAEYAHQCLEKFENQLAKCLDLTTKQHDKKAVGQLLTALKDLTGHYSKVILVEQVIKWAQALEDLKGRSHSQAAESVKELSTTVYESAKVVFREEVNKAVKLISDAKRNNWNKYSIEKIVADKSYAEYAHQCLQEFNNQLQECIHLLKSEETTGQHDEKTTEQLLTALKDVTDHYDKVITVKQVIELAQARKHFQAKGDLAAARSVRKAFEKFESPQHLIEHHRKNSTEYWLKKIINEVNDELVCKAIDNVIGRDKINQESKLKKLDKGLNMIKNSNYSSDNLIVFEIGNETVRLRKDVLKDKWSGKEWFSKLEERQMFENGQVKEVMKEYCENYLKAVDKKIQDLVQEGDPQIWTRCQPDTLIKILQCGCFKSQFETGTSGDGMSFGTEGRANSEYGWAGIPRNMPAPFRFIYGYATTSPSGEADIVGGYGPVAVHLRPELKEFAGQKLGGSLYDSDGSTNLASRPTFFDNADRRCIRVGYNYNILEIKEHEHLEKTIKYQEVQIPAVYKEDIQEVVFHTRMDKKPKLKNKLIKLLEQHAISYRNAPLIQKEDIFKAALRSSYKEVLDSSGKVIFTEDDYRSYQQCKEKIVTAIGKQDDVLIDSLQKIPFFEDLYGMSVGVWEGYTLKEHTSMVLEQFRKYQMENWNSSLLTAGEFQLMLAIHDIGKPQAVQETGNRSEQHEYNGRIIPGFLKWLGIF